MISLPKLRSIHFSTRSGASAYNMYAGYFETIPTLKIILRHCRRMQCHGQSLYLAAILPTAIDDNHCSPHLR